GRSSCRSWRVIRHPRSDQMRRASPGGWMSVVMSTGSAPKGVVDDPLVLGVASRVELVERPLEGTILFGLLEIAQTAAIERGAVLRQRRIEPATYPVLIHRRERTQHPSRGSDVTCDGSGQRCIRFFPSRCGMLLPERRQNGLQFNIATSRIGPEGQQCGEN